MNRFEFNFMNFDKLMVGFSKEDDFLQDENEAPAVGIVDYYGKEDSKVKTLKKNAKRTEIIDNFPTTGFKIVQSMIGNSTSGDFSLYDPRGFVVKHITPYNITHLLLNARIENGEILNPCFWTRTGGYMFLLPTESDIEEVYNREVELKTNTSIKDYQKGDIVTLKNGFSGVYMGRVTFEAKRYATREKGCKDFGSYTSNWLKLPEKIERTFKYYVVATQYQDFKDGVYVVRTRYNLLEKMVVKEAFSNKENYQELKKQISDQPLLREKFWDVKTDDFGILYGERNIWHEDCDYKIVYVVSEKDL